MINNLRAKPLKQKEISNNNIFELSTNNPKQIDKSNNVHIAHIFEIKENEELYIHSQFNDNAFAIICNEFFLNFIEKSKRVDFSYYYFSEDNKVKIYLYDMKKTFSGIDMIIHLVEQWKQSIKTAQACVVQLDDYYIDTIQLGIITENNDVDGRIRDLEPILHLETVSSNISSFIASKRKANTSDIIAKSKLLKGFDEGKVTINGCSYEYDVRLFDNRTYHMYFNDGVLEK